MQRAFGAGKLLKDVECHLLLSKRKRTGLRVETIKGTTFGPFCLSLQSVVERVRKVGLIYQSADYA